MADDPKWMEHAAAKMKAKGTAGSFSRAAKKAGKSTQSFAKQEMKSGSPAMKKKANFARNASKASR